MVGTVRAGSPQRPLVFVLILFLAMALAGCQPARMGARDVARGQILRINLQGGIAYAPLVVMQVRQLLERRVPGLTIEWKRISGTEQIHDALVTGGLDIATGSPTAFLLARERGVPVRVLAAISEVPIAIVGGRSDLRGLRDLRPDDRVAVSALNSHEHTVLRMAALRELGDWQALDRAVVARPAPEALQALLARRDVAAQVLVPPLLGQALDASGVHRLVDAVDILGGPATAVLAYSTPMLRDRQSGLFGAFLDALAEAIDLASRDRQGTSKLLAERDDVQLTAPQLARHLEDPAVTFSTRVRGLTTVADFLRRSRRLDRGAASWPELVFGGVEGS